MRKDVKLGFAIGGVLLAVLIVYVLVVPGGGDKRLSSATGDAASKNENGGGGGAGSGVSLTPVVPPPATQPRSGSGATIAGTPPAAPPASFTPPAGGTDPFEQPEGVASNGGGNSNKAKDVDWSKLLNDAQTPTLMAPTEKKTAAKTTPPSASSETHSVQLASTSTPDITKPGPTPLTQPGSATEAKSPAATPTPPAPAAEEPASAHNSNESTPTTPAETTVAPPPSTPAQPEQHAANDTSPTATNAAGQKIHVVQSGETLSTISLSEYGNPNLYPAIMRANPGIDPQKLRPNMKVVIPPAPEAKPAAAPAAAATPAARPTRAQVSGDTAQTSSTKVEAPIDPQTQYRVQQGDNLYSIAKKLYGRGDRYIRLHEANKATLGEDVNSLKVGQVLTLPEPPTAKQ